ncbi:MAG: hypothetical protein CMJ64_07620, partial [Planctomycetaceae bacterium]|nr:hypothetical protein [Planctomycetaceae bacterium]
MNGNQGSSRVYSQMKNWSWIANALPYLEQQHLYDRIDFGSHNDQGSVNVTARQSILQFTSVHPMTWTQFVLTRTQVTHLETAAGRRRPALTTSVIWALLGRLEGLWSRSRFQCIRSGGLTRFTKGQKTGTPWVNGDWDIDLPRLQGVFQYRGSVKLAKITEGG